jgi:hypothetical protein
MKPSRPESERPQLEMYRTRVETFLKGLAVSIKWKVGPQKRSIVGFCGLTAAKKLPVGEEPNAASKAVKKTEDAEEQPEEKA